MQLKLKLVTLLAVFWPRFPVGRELDKKKKVMIKSTIEFEVDNVGGHRNLAFN